MRRCVGSAGIILALVSSNAVAAPPAASGSATPTGSGAPAAATPPGSAHAKPDAGPVETSEQRKVKFDYIRATSTKIREIANKDHKAVTKDEHSLINVHWRRAMRALRVRELAEDDHDAKMEGRVDSFLKKTDDRFFDALTGLNAKAPPRPATPVVASPLAGASVPLAGAFTFKLVPTAGLQHVCTIVQVIGHESASWVDRSKTDGCVFAADKPEHAKFKAGTAHLHVWAHQTTPQGEIYSDAANITFELTGPGGAAPPAASGGPK